MDPRWDDEERWWGTVRRVACESPLVDWQHQEKEKEEAYASDGGGVRVVDTLREALRDTHGAFVYVGVCLSVYKNKNHSNNTQCAIFWVWR